MVKLLQVWNIIIGNRKGDALIVAGTLVPAFGGTLTALGESATLALTLMVGVILLWFGYHRAASARESQTE